MVSDFALPNFEPVYYRQLNNIDQQNYNILRNNFIEEHSKSHSITITNILAQIKNFIIKNDSMDGVRSLVTGICWINDSIAINFRQLRLLTSICKSNLQSALLNQGYRLVKSRSSLIKSLTEKIPDITYNAQETREWTFYSYFASTPTFSLVESDSVEYFNMDNNLNFKTEPSNSKSFEEFFSFFDDPFCLPPLFLVEDAKKIVS